MAAVKETTENAIGKGKPGPGRPRGRRNRTTRVLKDAILLAAEQVGEDGEGREGLVGYLRTVARQDVRAFASLLGRVLPLQVEGGDGGPIVVEIIKRRYDDEK